MCKIKTEKMAMLIVNQIAGSDWKRGSKKRQRGLKGKQVRTGWDLGRMRRPHEKSSNNQQNNEKI